MQKLALVVALLLIGLWWWQVKPAPPGAPKDKAPVPGAQASPPPLLAEPKRPAGEIEAAPAGAPADNIAILQGRLVPFDYAFDVTKLLDAAAAWPDIDAEAMYRLAEGMERCALPPSQATEEERLWLTHCQELPAAWRQKTFIQQLKVASADQGFILGQLMQGFMLSYQADSARFEGRDWAALQAKAISYFQAAADQGALMALAVLANAYADPNNGEYYQPVRALAYTRFLKALVPDFSAPGLESRVADLPYYDKDEAAELQRVLEDAWLQLPQLWR